MKYSQLKLKPGGLVCIQTLRHVHYELLPTYAKSTDFSNKTSFFSGNDLTQGVTHAYDIRVDETFIMVGGVNGGENSPVISDVLIKYLPESGTLMPLPGKMKLPRFDHIAILVERSIFPPCE